MELPSKMGGLASRTKDALLHADKTMSQLLLPAASATELLSFSGSLSVAQARRVSVAQWCFYATLIVPPLLYFGGATEWPAKFPCTVSYTIREGSPKWAQHFFWAVGWIILGQIIFEQKNRAAAVFALQMVATGFLSIVMFPMGHGLLITSLHVLTAGPYMLDQILLLELLGAPRKYIKGFVYCFMIASTSFWIVMLIQMAAGTNFESMVTTVEGWQERSAMSVIARYTLFVVELLLMVFENGLFAVTLMGMTPGLPQLHVKGKRA